MQRYKVIVVAFLAAIFVMVPSVLSAQVNTSSPYSMYGLGEINTLGTQSTRSMGGAGVAMRSYADINLLNPASYSMALRKSVLFNYGLDGANYFNSQKVGDATKKNSFVTANLYNIALQVPLAKRLGMAFSVSPYSSVGYDISDSMINPNIGLIAYNYSGSGDVTEVKFGVGWEPFKNFSIGVAAKYYWGEIVRTFQMVPLVITGTGNYSSTMGEFNYTISNFKAQVGMQWSPIATTKQRLVLGATYDLGGDLNPLLTNNVVGSNNSFAIIAKSEQERISIVLPGQISGGAYYQNQSLTLALDYDYQNWYSRNKNVEHSGSGVAIAYNNFGTVKMGAEYIPNRNDVRNYLNRITYRGGLRYGGYQYTIGDQSLNQYAVTAGFGFPIKIGGISKIDFGVEYGGRGNHNMVNNGSVGLVKQSYVKFSLGFTMFGEDYWFQRPRID